MVPTVDTVRYNFLVSALMRSVQPVLLVGPVGTGKTSIAQSVCSQLDSSKYSVLTINMSAQTSSNNVQEIIESRVEKRTKGVATIMLVIPQVDSNNKFFEEVMIYEYN